MVNLTNQNLISIIIWIARLLSVPAVGVGLLGLLFFSDYYFSSENIGDTAIAVAPLIAMAVGAFSPSRLLTNLCALRLIFAILFAGGVALSYEIYGDLTLLNGPDYAAASLRIIGLGLIGTFALRARHLNKTAAKVGRVSAEADEEG